MHSLGMRRGEFELGASKLFVKDADGLFKLEIEREKARSRAATRIQVCIMSGPCQGTSSY